MALTFDPTVLYSFVTQYVQTSGTIRLYAGPVPATADEALTNQVLLATWNYTTRSGGTVHPITISVPTAGQVVDVVASGTATFFRMADTAGPQYMQRQGVVGLPGSGADMIINQVVFTAGDTVALDSAAFSILTQPAGTAILSDRAKQQAAQYSSASAAGQTSRVWRINIYDDSTLLVSVLSTGLAQAAISGGTAELSATFPANNIAVATGTANRFEMYRGDPSPGTFRLTLSGTVGLPSASPAPDMIMDNLNIVAGDNIRVAACKFIWS